MNLVLHDNEPLHGALAAYKTTEGEHPRGIIRQLLPDTGSVSFSFVLPIHLDLLLKRLPSNLGFDAKVCAERHTFFPAVAAFLEEGEREDVLVRMAEGHRVAPYAICHAPRAGAEAERVRYCPECARADRGVGAAYWRMRHNLWGVRACAEHRCQLEPTPVLFGEPRALHDADDIVPESVSPSLPADSADIDLARDLGSLFDAGSPRPGRVRIASVLRARAVEAGYVRGPSRQIAIGELLVALEAHYGSAWLEERKVDLPRNTNMWPRNCMAEKPDVHPAFLVALMGRFLGLPLPELLRRAMCGAPPTVSPEPQAPQDHIEEKPSDVRIAAAKERFLAARRENPAASRTDLRYALARNACEVLVIGDPDWLEANFPLRKKKEVGVSLDWSTTDLELCEKVEASAAALRAEISRPDRITETVLRRSVDGMRWVASGWREKLPRFHAALERCADTDATYGERRARWYAREMAEGRANPIRGVDLFLKRAALVYLAKKEPSIRAVVEQLLGHAAGPQT